MSPKEIIQWIQFAALVLKYGKEVIDRAVEIYKRIEEAFRGKSGASQEKAVKFNKAFVREIETAKDIKPTAALRACQNVDRIREGVWKTRPENLGKKPRSILGAKPGAPYSRV